MKTVNQLLDAVKAKHSISSDYKLAQHLGLTDGAIRHYRHGRSLPDERACQKIGLALEIDGDVLAAQMLSLRAKDEDTKAMWLRISHRLGGVAATVAMAVGVSSAPSPANAAARDCVTNCNGESVYYVKSRTRRRRSAMQFVADMLAPRQAGAFA